VINNMELEFNFGLTGRPEFKRDEELMVERITLIAEGVRLGYFGEREKGYKITDCKTKNYKPNMNTTIEGVGKDAQTVTNGFGAKRSGLRNRLILADPIALRALGNVLAKGEEKHGRSNIGEGWYEIPAEDHIDHALDHILLWRHGDLSEDHLAHAQCRVHMALAVEIRRISKRISEKDRS